MNIVKSALTPEKISRAYDIISHGSAVIEKRSDGKDWLTITTEEANDYATDWLTSEGVALIAGHSVAMPLKTFLSIMAPTEMGDGSLSKIDTYPIRLSGRALLNAYLPSSIGDRLIISPTNQPVVREKNQKIISPPEKDAPQETIPAALSNIRGLNYQQVPGDGHCLYYAVSLYVGANQNQLRQRVANYLETHLEDFQGFIDLTEGQELRDYIQSIRNGIEWADNIEIEILMRVFNRPIVVLGTDGNIRNWTVFDRFNADPIFVYYNGHNHYDALLRIDGYSNQQILEQLTGYAHRRVPINASIEVEPQVINREEANKQLVQGAIQGNLKMMENALRAGADPNYKIIAGSQYQCTVLHWAALGGPTRESTPAYTQSVKLLLAHGANISTRNVLGQTALHLATLSGNTYTMECLIDKGINVHAVCREGRTAFYEANAHNHKAMGYLIYRAQEANKQLIQGAMTGNLELIRRALLAGADANHKIMSGSQYQCTVIHWAALRGHEEATKLLQAAGANIHAVNVNRQTTSHLAAMSGNISSLEYLMSQGVNMNAVCNQGWNTYDYANAHNHDAMRFLISKGQTSAIQVTATQKAIAAQLTPAPATQHSRRITTIQQARAYRRSPQGQADAARRKEANGKQREQIRKHHEDYKKAQQKKRKEQEEKLKQKQKDKAAREQQQAYDKNKGQQGFEKHQSESDKRFIEIFKNSGKKGSPSSTGMFGKPPSCSTPIGDCWPGWKPNPEMPGYCRGRDECNVPNVKIRFGE